MSKLLLVTAVCSSDIHLVEKRQEWLRHLGSSSILSDILFVNDGSLSDAQMQSLAASHHGLFRNIFFRKITDRAVKNVWPYNVNHVWRTIAHMIAGEYGEKIDTSPYFSWFYFEPDVTPLNKDWAAIIEQQYAFHRKPFLGYIHETQATQQNKDGTVQISIRHMNGAGCYPITSQYYNQRMMLMDNLPWDVAGLDVVATHNRIATIPREAYCMAFGTSQYRKDGESFVAHQEFRDGRSSEITLKIDTQILHHGCKDGSLIDLLLGKKEDVTELSTSRLTKGMLDRARKILDMNPTKEYVAESIRIDFESGVKWKDLIKKYKISPKALSAIVKKQPVAA